MSVWDFGALRNVGNVGIQFLSVLNEEPVEGWDVHQGLGQSCQVRNLFRSLVGRRDDVERREVSVPLPTTTA
jgi:hypothetical protein